jgi:hypothetical protein
MKQFPAPREKKAFKPSEVQAAVALLAELLAKGGAFAEPFTISAELQQKLNAYAAAHMHKPPAESRQF